MSEVIESYIRRHPGLTQSEAFDGFLREERIRAWIGDDEGRKERLRREFARVWESVDAPAPSASARAGPSGPQAVQQARTFHVEVEQAPAPAASAVPARKLQVMCTACSRVNVWIQGSHVACRSCGRAFDDMLQLIRVTPVGPFEFLFGEGWKGAATAGGIAVGLVGLYLLLRGF